MTQQNETAAAVQHTPGPWRVMPGSVVSEGRTDNGHPVFVAAYGSEDYDKRSAEIDANARLIAAAPILLDALIKADDHIWCECVIHETKPNDICEGHRVIWDALRAARGEA